MDGYFTIESGKIKERTKLDKMLQGLRDGRWLLKFERKNKRTNNQNAYYWVCVCQIVLDGLRDMGWNEFETPEDAHEFLKLKFLKKQFVSEQGEMLESLGSTKKLSTVEFNEYIEKVSMWAAEYLNCYIPPPASQSKLYQ